MSLSDVLSRISQLESLTPASLAGLQQPGQGGSSSSFAQALAAATSTDPSSTSPGSSYQVNGMESPYQEDGTESPGSAIVSAAASQIGVTEQPPGSNDGPAIAEYRTAVAGAQPGEPWCAYFASWAAQQAGEPLGPNGQGFGSVAEITDWAQGTGRLMPASATPQPGDLILFGTQHVGIVESVNSDGTLTTIEGNHNNAVQQVTRQPSEATGYVNLN